MGEKSMLQMRRTIWILLFAVAVGYVLQVFVYLIPVEWMEQQKIRTGEMMEKEQTRATDPVSGRIIDNYADSITVLLATYPGNESPFKQAAGSYYLTVKDMYPREALVASTLYGAQTEKVSYARYWHGSMLLIKPLLTVMDLGTIRYVNLGILLFLTVTATVLVQRTIPRSTVPFLLTMMLIAPTAVGQCLDTII